MERKDVLLLDISLFINFVDIYIRHRELRYIIRVI